jgi:hypothetical protein
MSRNLIRFLVAAVILNGMVVASTMVWAEFVPSKGDRAATVRGDFDYVFAAVTVPPQRSDAPANMTLVDFDQTFAGVSTPRRENTPPNRERLRNIGWKRILTPN